MYSQSNRYEVKNSVFTRGGVIVAVLVIEVNTLI